MSASRSRSRCAAVLPARSQQAGRSLDSGLGVHCGRGTGDAPHRRGHRPAQLPRPRGSPPRPPHAHHGALAPCRSLPPLRHDARARRAVVRRGRRVCVGAVGPRRRPRHGASCARRRVCARVRIAEAVCLQSVCGRGRALLQRWLQATCAGSTVLVLFLEPIASLVYTLVLRLITRYAHRHCCGGAPLHDCNRATCVTLLGVGATLSLYTSRSCRRLCSNARHFPAAVRCLPSSVISGPYSSGRRSLHTATTTGTAEPPRQTNNDMNTANNNHRTTTTTTTTRNNNNKH